MGGGPAGVVEALMLNPNCLFGVPTLANGFEAAESLLVGSFALLTAPKRLFELDWPAGLKRDGVPVPELAPPTAPKGLEAAFPSALAKSDPPVAPDEVAADVLGVLPNRLGACDELLLL